MQPHRSLDERRRAFVAHLYSLHAALTSDNPRHCGEARRTLARLRRCFSGPRHEAEAYDIIFPHDPPQREQQLWLLVGGLFGLHPHGNTAKGRTVGGAMRLLADERVSAQRRFTHLLCVDPQHLPHYLRQMIQLLRSGDIAIDYHRLLTDLVLINTGRHAAHEVRLRWARDYHRHRLPGTRSLETDDATADTEVAPVTRPINV